jgi:DNA modification methylase
MTVTFINSPNGTGVAKPAIPPAKTNGGLRQTSTAGPGLKKRNDLLPKMSVVTVKIKDLLSARNPVRKLSNRQIGKARRSIAAFGFRNPVLIGEDREIIDGHTRVEAARQLGLTEVHCIIADDLSEAELRALRIALNRIQETGEFDEQALKLEFVWQLDHGTDLAITGFESQEIDHIINLDLGGEGKDPLDEFGELPKPDADAVTHPGDLWFLGDHRLLCGNARNHDDLRRVTGAYLISMVFTDPPYNVRVNGHVRVVKGRSPEFAEASGEMSGPEFKDFLIQSIGNAASAVKAGSVLFTCMDWRHADVLMAVLSQLGLDLLNICVWAKPNGGMGSLYRSRHELVFVAKQPGAPHTNNVALGKHGRYRTNVWEYAGATGGRKSAEDDFSLHPTVKPVGLVRDAILDVTAMDEVVLDPFLGSGTTVLAAELAGRVCCGLEISPAYVDVAIRRWEKMTGRDAVHAVTGLTFALMRAERASSPEVGQGASPAVPETRVSQASPKPLSEEDF